MKQQASAKKKNVVAADLLKQVRAIDNMYHAWVIVRSNVNASKKKKIPKKKKDKKTAEGKSDGIIPIPDIRQEVAIISKNPIPYLRKIMGKLQRKTFKFQKQKAVPIPPTAKGKKHRPIVVAPLVNRLVQRAILNVLQEGRKPGLLLALGKIPEIIRTETSVGGVPERGIQNAMALIKGAIDKGFTHYMRSDIRQFFTKIPKPQVVEYIRRETKNDEFADLFSEALATELENEDEIKPELLELFPLDDQGVPQGSSLSALAGNIILEKFDRQMNGRGIITIRYIDDFVILGKSEKAVKAAFESAKAHLKELGMDAYGPEHGVEKAKIGVIDDGFDFLGCSIRRNGIAPQPSACNKILKAVSDDFSKSIKDIRERLKEDVPRRAEEGYVQTLAKVDRRVRGWGDGLAFCTNRLPFAQVDQKIQGMVETYRKTFHGMMQSQNLVKQRRAFGLALLTDTPTKELKKQDKK